MAFFNVTIEKIRKLEQIDNADNLELAELVDLGFELVVRKGSFEIGDEVLYFPIDSILPDDILKKLNLIGKLSGNGKNRVKTVKLRGQISQGLVTDLSLIDDLLKVKWKSELIENPNLITEFLKVKKFDPHIYIPKKNKGYCPVNLFQLPVGLSVYDIESTDRYKKIFNEIIDAEIEVEVTEKTEGMNFSVTYDNKRDKIFVNQRKFSIKKNDEEINNEETRSVQPKHLFWKLAEDEGIIGFVKQLILTHKNSDITVYGEAIGPKIQGNIYKLNKHEIRIFDIKINDWWMSPVSRYNYTYSYFKNLDKHVPIIGYVNLKKWMNGRKITELANGKSKINTSVLREGIVIKMMNETTDKKGNRVIFKQRDPVYLSKTNN